MSKQVLVCLFVLHGNVHMHGYSNSSFREKKKDSIVNQFACGHVPFSQSPPAF